jgi:hypothetical protein
MEQRRIIGYCAYCKDPIYDDEKLSKYKGRKYHEFCLEQMNSYYDSYETE